MTPPLAEEILCCSAGATLKPVFQQELVPECLLAFLQHYKYNCMNVNCANVSQNKQYKGAETVRFFL